MTDPYERMHFVRESCSIVAANQWVCRIGGVICVVVAHGYQEDETKRLHDYR